MSVTLPTRRDTVVDPPGEYHVLREKEPVSRLSLLDGKLGWLLTRHDDVRAVLADERFSSDRTKVSPPLPFRPPSDPINNAGLFIGMDAPEHTRYRRALAGWFSTRRMRALASPIERIIADHLAAMARTGSPADLVTAFALPIPSLVICELLGVPFEDRAAFQAWTADVLRISEDDEPRGAARLALRRYMHDLVRRKRREPDDALLSSLIREEPGFTPEELAGIGILLLVAGHETTANMLALGSYTLLRHPDQARLLRERPELIDTAVEELLRYLSIIQFGLTRVAREDVVLGGRRIQAGETVVCAIPAANRDPEHFAEPDRLDITRPPSQHVAFGHGVHQCLGQQLARVEMKIAYPALFGRFPGLRLAVADEAIPVRTDMLVYGVHRLPVAW